MADNSFENSLQKKIDDAEELFSKAYEKANDSIIQYSTKNKGLVKAMETFFGRHSSILKHNSK